MVQKRSTIEVDILDWHMSKTFLGTEDETYREANDWMHAVILEYVNTNDVEDDKVEAVADLATHTIIWDDSDFLCMYAVFEEDVDEPILGAFMTRAEAEELIFSLCEEFAEETINCDDPREVFGHYEWDIPSDYWYLMDQCALTYGIQTIPVFGVEEVY